MVLEGSRRSFESKAKLRVQSGAKVSGELGRLSLSSGSPSDLQEQPTGTALHPGSPVWSHTHRVHSIPLSFGSGG